MNNTTHQASTSEIFGYNPMATAIVAACLGVFIDSHWHVVPLFWVALFLVFLAIWLMTHLTFHRYRIEKNVILTSVLIFMIVLSFYGTRNALQCRTFSKNDIGFLKIYDEHPILLIGRITSMPVQLRRTTEIFEANIERHDIFQFSVDVLRVRNGKKWQSCSGRIRVFMSGETFDADTNDLIQIQGFFSRPQAPGNTFEYDNRIRSYGNRELCVLHVPLGAVPTILEKGKWYHLSSCISRLRHQAKATLERYIDSEYVGLAKTMLLGLDEDMDRESIERFQKTGTVHILAISGLHLAIVGGFLLLLLRFFHHSSHYKAILIGVFIGFYLVLTDMSVPVLRSALLIYIFYGSIFFARAVTPINSLCFAALILLFYNPGEMYQFGTQLSFLCTGFFIWAQTEIYKTAIDDNETKEGTSGISEETVIVHPVGLFRRLMALCGRVWLFFIKGLEPVIGMNIVLWLVGAPLIASQINIVTPVAIVLNPLIWFPMSIALIGSLLTVIAGWLTPFLCPILGGITSMSYDAMVRLAGSFCGDGGWFYMPAPPGWWLAGFYSPLIFWTIFVSSRPKKIWMISFVVLWCLVGWLVWSVGKYNKQKEERLDVNVMSIGHGGAALFSFPDGRNILFDCGSFSSPEKTGNLVARTILNQGRTSLDLLVLSHPDSDHFNGLASLLRTITIRGIVIPPGMFEKQDTNVKILYEFIDACKIPVYAMGRGDSLEILGFPEFVALHPDIFVRTGESNADSLVFLVEHLKRRLLLTGDLDSPHAFFLKDPPVKVHTLFIPHHGGKSRNQRELLSWCQPEQIIISDGLRSYNPDIQSQLRKEGYDIFSTFLNGEIKIQIGRAWNDTQAMPGTIRVFPAFKHYNSGRVREAAPKSPAS